MSQAKQRLCLPAAFHSCSPFFPVLLAIFRYADAILGLEFTAEAGMVGIADPGGDLRHRELRLCQHFAGLLQAKLGNILDIGFAGVELEQPSQMGLAGVGVFRHIHGGQIGVGVVGLNIVQNAGKIHAFFLFEQSLLTAQQLDTILDPRRMTTPLAMQEPIAMAE